MTFQQLIDDVVSTMSARTMHIGASSSNLSADDVSLQDEIARKQVDVYIDENTMVNEVYFDETEVNDVAILGVGLIGNGTDSIDTGQLYAGGNVNVIKTNTQSLTIAIEITFEEA